MSIEFTNSADDFYVNTNIQTTMPLPESRETILHFCESVQKQFPNMNCFFQKDTGEYVLEGDRESGSYPWLELQPNRITSGYFSPPSLASAYELHKFLLNRSFYFLGISPLDIDSFDVVFAFNLEYKGNRDAVVTDTLLAGSPLAAFFCEAGNKPLEFEPSFVTSLSDDCYLQARLAIETHSSSYQVRTGQFESEPISIYLTVRQYPTPKKMIDTNQAFETQSNICEDLCTRIIIPQIVQPLANAIATL